MVTVPVGVTETFLFHFFSSVSYDVLGSCVHSVSSCFKENDITYSKVQEVKKYLPQAITDQEVKQERSFSRSGLIPPASFFAYDCLLCLQSSQALFVIEHFIFLSLLFMFLIILGYNLLFQPERYSLEIQCCLRVPESGLLRPNHLKDREDYLWSYPWKKMEE